MANVFVDDTSLQAIAGAIREKTGGTATMKPGDMAGAIRGIESGVTLNADIISAKVRDGIQMEPNAFVQFEPDYGTAEDFTGYPYFLSWNRFDAVTLDGNRIFAVYEDYDAVLKCCVMTATQRGLRMGESCELKREALQADPYATVLDENRVMVLYAYDDGLRCTVCQVGGEKIHVISAGGDALIAISSSGLRMKSLRTGENRVMIIYSNGDYDISVAELFVESDGEVKKKHGVAKRDQCASAERILCIRTGRRTRAGGIRNIRLSLCLYDL